MRAFVKIQDGCSFSCAFCVIPLVRGGTRSRTADAVLTEIRRRVAQGHREVVLTGVNLGCFRDRAAGLTLAGLIREAGAIEGLARLRLSSIEINHVTPDLIDAMRDTPTVARHLHVPLQSGDDGVLQAMGRRYSIGQYRARLEGCEDFNLTTDVIVGFPTEDEPRVREHAGGDRRDRDHEGARVPVLATTRNAHRRGRSRRSAGQARAKCPPPGRLGRRVPRSLGESRVGSEDVVLVDRPGLGYADDYTPWFVAAPVGSLVRARAVGVTDDGVLGGGSMTDCLFCRLVESGDHVRATEDVVAIRDIAPAAETHLLVLPRRHIDTFRDIAAFPDDEAAAMLRFVADLAAAEGLDDYRLIVNVGPGAGQTVFHLHWHVLGGKLLPGFH